jgi:hypothetical protein
MTPTEQLQDLMSTILNGDESVRTVRELEKLLVESFLETPLFEELTEPLSMYNPGAGAPYFSASELRARVARASERQGELIPKE